MVPLDPLRRIDLMDLLPGVGTWRLNLEFPFERTSLEAVVGRFDAVSSDGLRLHKVKFKPNISSLSNAEFIVGSFSICKKLLRIFLIDGVKASENILLVEELIMR